MIIPLSLYVTIECTKLLQVYLMHEDRQLYDELYDKRVECKALNIPEELGQVSLIRLIPLAASQAYLNF